MFTHYLAAWRAGRSYSQATGHTVQVTRNTMWSYDYYPIKMN